MKIHNIIDITGQFVAPNEKKPLNSQRNCLTFYIDLKKMCRKVDVIFVFIAHSYQFSTKPRPTYVS